MILYLSAFLQGQNHDQVGEILFVGLNRYLARSERNTRNNEHPYRKFFWFFHIPVCQKYRQLFRVMKKGVPQAFLTEDIQTEVAWLDSYCSFHRPCSLEEKERREGKARRIMCEDGGLKG